MWNIIEFFDLKDVPTSDLCMQLADDTKEAHSECASDAYADVQSAIDILDSLRLAGKLSQEHFQDVQFFLQSAQENMMEGDA